MLTTSRTTVAFATIGPGNSGIRIASHRIPLDLKQGISGDEVAKATISASSVRRVAFGVWQITPKTVLIVKSGFSGRTFINNSGENARFHPMLQGSWAEAPGARQVRLTATGVDRT